MTMKDDYLWDGTGEPDPEVERLENLLAGYRTRRPAPEMPERPAAPTVLARPWRVYIPAVAASVVVMSIILGLWWQARQRTADGSVQSPPATDSSPNAAITVAPVPPGSSPPS